MIKVFAGASGRLLDDNFGSHTQNTLRRELSFGFDGSVAPNQTGIAQSFGKTGDRSIEGIPGAITLSVSAIRA